MSRFFVGQRVRIVSCKNSRMAHAIGTEDVIAEECPTFYSSWVLKNTRLTICGKSCSWHESDITPITDINTKVEWAECAWRPSGVSA